MTSEQNADLCEMLEHYKKEYKKELATLFSAFVSKHSLVPKNSSGRDADPEEIRKVLAMMQGLQSKKFVKTSGYIDHKAA